MHIFRESHKTHTQLTSVKMRHLEIKLNKFTTNSQLLDVGDNSKVKNYQKSLKILTNWSEKILCGHTEKN